jgi:RNA polymerase sigma-70 factor (ECF subfamily)
MDHEPDEYELAQRARDGDPEALSELVEQVRLRLFALAYAELRHYDDAQDVVSAALLRICRHVSELREPARVRPWMQSIVRNEARSRLRRRAGEPALWEGVEDEPAAGGGPSLLRMDIELALRRLPRDEAQTLALFYLERLSIREIAQQVGRPEGTIKRWLHLGRRLLAHEMEDYAPMAATPSTTPALVSAAVISSDMDSGLLQEVMDALGRAGFVDVSHFSDIDQIVTAAPGGKLTDWQLAEPLKGKRCFLIDEWVQGRSAFEIHTLLKILPELEESLFWMLAASPVRDQTVMAAWAAGVECFLTKPFSIDEIERFGTLILAKLNQSGSVP